MTAIQEIDWEAYRTLVPVYSDPDKDDYSAMAFREVILLKYLYLTKRIAANMAKYLPSYVGRDELESWAAFGLLRAVKRFDNTLGVPFEAFAMDTMKSVIRDEIRKQDNASRGLRKKQKDIIKAEEYLTKNGKAPTLDEIAEHLDISTDEINKTRYKAEIASNVYIDSCPELLDKAVDIEDSELVQQLQATLATSVQKLPIREQAIVALRYYENKKFSDIASLLRMSEVSVGQLHKKAVLGLWSQLQDTALVY